MKVNAAAQKENSYREDFVQRSQQLKNLLSASQSRSSGGAGVAQTGSGAATVNQSAQYMSNGLGGSSHNLSDVTNVAMMRQSRNSGQDSVSQQQQQAAYSGAHVKLLAAVGDLYADTKSKLDDNALLYLRKSLPHDDQVERLARDEPQTLLSCVKVIVSHLVKIKLEAEDALQKKTESECSDYEQMLQKLESEVRQHIRIEQQLKLYAENTQQKLEDTVKEKEQVEKQYADVRAKLEDAKNQNFSLAERFKQGEKEIMQLKKTIADLQAAAALGGNAEGDKERLAAKVQYVPVKDKRSFTKAEGEGVENREDMSCASSSVSSSQQQAQNQMYGAVTGVQGRKDALNGGGDKANRMNTESLYNKDFLRNSSKNLDEKIRKSMDKYHYLNPGASAAVLSKGAPEFNEKDARASLLEQAAIRSQANNIANRVDKVRDVRATTTVQAHVSLQGAQSQAQQQGAAGSQQSRQRSRSKYTQEYQTLDSERIRSLSKKISEMQTCLTQRQTQGPGVPTGGPGSGAPEGQISTSTITHTLAAQQQQSQQTQAKRGERAISTHNSANGVSGGNQQAAYVATQNHKSTSGGSYTRPPSAFEMTQKQPQQRERETRTDSARSFSVDGQSKSAAVIKRSDVAQYASNTYLKPQYKLEKTPVTYINNQHK